MNIEKVDPHLTVKIVQGYVRNHRLGPDQLPDVIASVHRTLGQLGQQVQPAQVLTPAVSIRQSVHWDYVFCLDCGYRGKTLRRHISSRHGLTRDEDLRRWGLQQDHPPDGPGLFRAAIHPGKATWPRSQAKNGCDTGTEASRNRRTTC